MTAVFVCGKTTDLFLSTGFNSLVIDVLILLLLGCCSMSALFVFDRDLTAAVASCFSLLYCCLSVSSWLSRSSTLCLRRDIRRWN